MKKLTENELFKYLNEKIKPYRCSVSKITSKNGDTDKNWDASIVEEDSTSNMEEALNVIEKL